MWSCLEIGSLHVITWDEVILAVDMDYVLGHNSIGLNWWSSCLDHHQLDPSFLDVHSILQITLWHFHLILTKACKYTNRIIIFIWQILKILIQGGYRMAKDLTVGTKSKDSWATDVSIHGADSTAKWPSEPYLRFSDLREPPMSSSSNSCWKGRSGSGLATPCSISSPPGWPQFACSTETPVRCCSVQRQQETPAL